MFLLLMTLVFTALAIGLSLLPERYLTPLKSQLPSLLEPVPLLAIKGVGITVMGGLALTSFVLISTVIIDQNSVGHLKRIYFGSALPDGRVIAQRGEQGLQADILGPGFHIIPFGNLIFEIEQLPLVNIPEGRTGLLVSRDGQPLPNGQFISTIFTQDDLMELLNARNFLEKGGQRGPQQPVLTPGSYRLNRYLFEVTLVDALDVPRGSVAVIKSNVNERNDCQSLPLETAMNQLVDKGCAGVQREPLMPNRYYLNTIAYNQTIIPTAVQTWSYRGGFESRRIDLTVDGQGNITQIAIPFNEPVPESAADRAIITNIEGWRVPLEVRVLIQVNPLDAALVVSSVGSLDEVLAKIGTPTLRSVVRNVTGSADRKVLDLINQRQQLEELVQVALGRELAKAGVTLREVRFGDPVIPPELLVTRQREQLATQLETTYEQERQAQIKRAEVERARAEAGEQGRLVTAEFDVRISEQNREQLRLQGEGEKLKLVEIANGQQAQVNVLGRESALQLAMLREILLAAVQNPAIVKVPTVMVNGGSSSLEGAAAVLGASNIIQSLGVPSLNSPQRPAP